MALVLSGDDLFSLACQQFSIFGELFRLPNFLTASLTRIAICHKNVFVFWISVCTDNKLRYLLNVNTNTLIVQCADSVHLHLITD